MSGLVSWIRKIASPLTQAVLTIFFCDKLKNMAESLAFSKTADRKTVYEEIAPQIEALVADETDLTANLANICAVLKEAFGFFWIGFYLKKENQLVLNAVSRKNRLHAN